MSTIRDKINYLKGTKQMLIEALRECGKNISDDATFEEIATAARDVYDVHYGPGTPVLNFTTDAEPGSLEAKLDYLRYYCNAIPNIVKPWGYPLRDYATILPERYGQK